MMKDKLPAGKSRNIWLAAAIGIACWAVGAVTEYLYADTDNFWIATVVNGLYSRDTYTIFLHPFLCRFIGLLARLLPTADAFTLLSRAAVLFGICFLAFLILAYGRSRLEKFSYIFLLPGTVFILALWNQNFTVQAAFFSGVGFLALFFGREKKRPAYGVIGTLYVCLGLMWRWEGAALFLPFALLVLLVRWIAKKGRRRAYLLSAAKYLGACVLCAAVLLFARNRINATEPYRADIAYNAARSTVQDFPLKDWAEVSGMPSEISEIDYIAMSWWVLFDTENINASTLSQVGYYGTDWARVARQNGVADAISEMFRALFHNGAGVPFLIGAAILLLGKLLLSRGSIWYKAAGALSLCGSALIIFYFTFTGRAPARIWEAVLLADLVTLTVLCASAEDPRREKIPVWCANITIALVILFVGHTLSFGSLHRPRLALTARTGYDESILSDTFRGDDLYVWDADTECWYKTVMECYTEKGKLPSRDFLDHNICTGSWLYGQHYYNDYLTRLGIPNPAQALLFREHTYLVSNNIWVFQEYLRAHYGDPIAEQVGEVAGIPVWQFHLG